VAKGLDAKYRIDGLTAVPVLAKLFQKLTIAKLLAAHGEADSSAPPV
jgi:hypothetical protein